MIESHFYYLAKYLFIMVKNNLNQNNQDYYPKKIFNLKIFST
jgi:hypothetical protein